MKALVTGGGGFLGRAITEMLLGRGDHVRIFSRNRYPDVEKLGAEGVQGDLRDLDAVVKACMGIDVVFHTAALAGIWGDLKLYTEVNVTGTQHVIVGCKRRGVGKLLYTSSPSVVFNMQDERGIDETTPYPPRFFNPYSETKALAEQTVLKANGSDGLLTCSLRPHLLWGPRDNHLLPRLIRRARKRQLRIIGDGRNMVDLTYVENAAMAHLLACDAMTPKRVAGEAYFISDGSPVVLWDWINVLLEQLGIHKVRKRIPAPAAYALGYCFERVYAWMKKQDEPRLTRFLARALSCSHFYNIAKARRDFNYRPVVNNDEGVRRTVAYFRDLRF
ncbi:MAG: NAD-dependent epimerase/dehydratase family protein [Planctomycetota bacterium]|nr:NAD-dependent epimerase/dehydratase family protein [Planctomycetota bacterium]